MPHSEIESKFGGLFDSEEEQAAELAGSLLAATKQVCDGLPYGESVLALIWQYMSEDKFKDVLNETKVLFAPYSHYQSEGISWENWCNAVDEIRGAYFSKLKASNVNKYEHDIKCFFRRMKLDGIQRITTQ